jgi:hypothetical protein
MGTEHNRFGSAVGAQIIGGKITHKKVAEAFVLEYHPAESHID